MKKHYIDLKDQDRLFVLRKGLIQPEIMMDVLGFRGDEIKVHVKNEKFSARSTIPRAQYFSIGNYVGIFNFGTRGRGNRVHVRLEMPNHYHFILNHEPKVGDII